MASAPLPSGYECEFVDNVPESLTCPVCLLPFRDPHLLGCCGAKYCAECIGRVKESGQPCPICREHQFNSLLDKKDQREVLGLKVHCSRKKEGCQWIGELRHLAEHEKDECPQRPVDIKLIRKMEQRHMVEIEAVRKEFTREMEKRDRAHKEEMKHLEESMNNRLSRQEKLINVRPL